VAVPIGQTRWVSDGDTYTHGHDAAVLRSHSQRSVENSAAYLRPHLRRGQSLLDVGCGPATITAEFAAIVGPGQVVGIEMNDDIVETARRTCADAGVEVEVRRGDVYALESDDDTFDVVHAHQVLQHLSDPVKALREMRRVCRPDGLVACRDADYGSFHWWPPEPRIDRWNDVYHRVTVHNRAQADAGRWLRSWALSAGFAEVDTSGSMWAFATAEQRSWWAELWADRSSPGSSFADQAIEYGFATEADLAEIGAGFSAWAADDRAVFFVPHGEILCRP